MKLRFCRSRKACTSSSSVGPSAPWFHDRLWLSPSQPAHGPRRCRPPLPVSHPGTATQVHRRVRTRPSPPSTSGSARHQCEHREPTRSPNAFVGTIPQRTARPNPDHRPATRDGRPSRIRTALQQPPAASRSLPGGSLGPLPQPSTASRTAVNDATGSVGWSTSTSRSHDVRRTTTPEPADRPPPGGADPGGAR
jgi:hypothetical protein